ncbi:MAG: VOC family protein [Rhodospirillaceae bacterium]|nr:VOC family protein [Rhodospirillaceae bacterium]
MALTASQKLGIQGLGWVVRRVPQGPKGLVPFYQSALGLRQLRPPGPTGAVMLWAGDLTMFEASTLAASSDAAARQNEITVLMRTRQFERAQTMVNAAGATRIGETPGRPRTVTFTDPTGMMLAIREADDASPHAHDQIAAAQWRKGGTTLPNTPSLPSEFQDVAAIALRVVDPVAMAAFYSDLLGLQPMGTPSAEGAILTLGRAAALELQPGGHRHDIPKDRDQVPDVWIARVYDHDGLAARLKQRNVPIVTQRQITGGKLTYAADPEGHLFGIQQRTPDLLPEGAKERVEDVLARALWAAETG